MIAGTLRSASTKGCTTYIAKMTIIITIKRTTNYFMIGNTGQVIAIRACLIMRAKNLPTNLGAKITITTTT